MVDFLSFTKQDWGSRTNTVLDKPVGTVNGTGLLLPITMINTTPPSAPDLTSLGFILVGQSDQWFYTPFSAYGRMYLYRKIAGSSEPVNYTVPHGTMYTNAELIAYSGPNVDQFLDAPVAFVTATSSAAGGVVNAALVTTVTPNARVITIRHSWDGLQVSPTSGWTERVDHPAGHVQDSLQALAGSVGPVAIPHGNSAGAGKPVTTVTLAMRHASAAPPGPYVPSWTSQIKLCAQGLAQCRVLFIGNSFMEGEGLTTRFARWIDRLIIQLRERMGLPGNGVGHTPPRYNTYVDPTSTSWRTASIPRNSSGTIVHIGNKIFNRAAGESFEWSFFGTGFSLYFDGGAGLGPLSVSVDGGAAESVPAQSSGRAWRWNKTGLSSTNHTVRVTAGTGGSMPLGIAAYDGDSPTSGITYLDWTWTGDTTDDWAPGGAHDIVGMKFDPHLVIHGKAGANDYLQASSTPAQCAARFQAQINEMKTWPSKPLILHFVLPLMPAGSEVDETAPNSLGYLLNDYREASLAVVAANEGVEALDSREFLTLTLADLAPDNLHMNEAGNETVADEMIELLLEHSGYIPLHWGDDNPSEIYAGDDEVTAIAIGDTMMWEKP